MTEADCQGIFENFLAFVATSKRPIILDDTSANPPKVGDIRECDIDKIQIKWVSPLIEDGDGKDYLVIFQVLESYSPEDSVAGSYVDLLWGDVVLSYPPQVC